MSGEHLAIGRYLVCGPAWYRIEALEGAAVRTTVAAGGARVHGRAVAWAASEIAAILRLGEGTIADGPPPAALEAQAAEEAPATNAAGKRRRSARR